MGDGLRYIGAAERRARLGLRHRLAGAARAGGPEEVAESLVALHGTDPATVYLAVGARLAEPAKTVAETERALYEERALVRMHGMRHTVFVFPTRLTAVVHASTGLAVAARERATLVKHMATAGAPDAAWLAEVEESALAALARRGQATAAELAEDEPRLREQFVYGAGKSYEGVHTVSTRLLRVLGVEGKVVRGRPLGSWTSSQFRWAVAPAASRTGRGRGPGGAAAALARGVRARDGGRPQVVDGVAGDGGAPGAGGDRARGGVAGRGHGVRRRRRRRSGGGARGALGGAAARRSTRRRWGGSERDWYLAPELWPSLFDRSGNVGPTVWWNGRVVGGWAQRTDGEIVWRLLDGAERGAGGRGGRGRGRRRSGCGGGWGRLG